MQPILYWVTEEENARLPQRDGSIFIDGRWVNAGCVGIDRPPITVHVGGGMTSNGQPFVLPAEAYAGLDELYDKVVRGRK